MLRLSWWFYKKCFSFKPKDKKILIFVPGSELDALQNLIQFTIRASYGKFQALIYKSICTISHKGCIRKRISLNQLPPAEHCTIWYWYRKINYNNLAKRLSIKSEVDHQTTATSLVLVIPPGDDNSWCVWAELKTPYLQNIRYSIERFGTIDIYLQGHFGV